jgi:Domain of unknown function (DUF4145)
MILLCGHCGNKTTFEERGNYYTQEPILNDERKIVWETISWHLFECKTCSKPTLIELTPDKPPFEVQRTLYPSIQTKLTNLPQKIERAYTAAIKVKNIEPNACAVLVGRTLEAACNHEEAQGRTLAQKLNYLAQNGRIPNTLAERARQLKELRNLGAHDAEDEVTERDVPIILDFLEAILEYLYVAPAKIEAVRARLTRLPIPENAGRET